MALLKGVPRVSHTVGTGADAIVLELPDAYGGIGSVVGVNKLTGDPPAGASGSEVGTAIKEGLVARIRVRYTEGGKTKTGDIVCELGKLKTALHSLRGKTYSGGQIKSAYLPTRRRFS